MKPDEFDLESSRPYHREWVVRADCGSPRPGAASRPALSSPIPAE
jgi:hypothetical protein